MRVGVGHLSFAELQSRKGWFAYKLSTRHPYALQTSRCTPVTHLNQGGPKPCVSDVHRSPNVSVAAT